MQNEKSSSHRTMSAHREMPGDLTRLTGSNLKSADAHAAIPRRKQSRLLDLDGAATSLILVTLQGRAPYRYLVGVIAGWLTRR